MTRARARDERGKALRIPHYRVAFLGSLDAFPANCFRFPFEQGFDQPRSSVLRALRPARVPLLERASSRFPGVLSQRIGHFAIYPKYGSHYTAGCCGFHLLMATT